MITMWLFDVHQALYQPHLGAIFSLIYINSASQTLAKVNSSQTQWRCHQRPEWHGL